MPYSKANKIPKFDKDNRVEDLIWLGLLGTETYTNSDIGTMKFRNMTEKATQRNFPKTSQLSAQDFMDVYEKLKGKGVITILSIHLSRELSGTINSANVASGMIDEIDEK